MGWLPSGRLGSHWQGALCIQGLAQARQQGVLGSCAAEGRRQRRPRTCTSFGADARTALRRGRQRLPGRPTASCTCWQGLQASEPNGLTCLTDPGAGHSETTGPQSPCHKGGLMSDPVSTGKLGTAAAIRSMSSAGFSGSLLPSGVMRTCQSDTRKGPLRFMKLEDSKSPHHKPCQASASCVTPAPATACPRHALSPHWAGRKGSWGRRERRPEHLLSTVIE